MKILCLQWILGGCFFLMVIYAAAISLTSALRIIFSQKIPLSLGIIIIGVIYTAVTWHCYFNSHIPLTIVIPWMELIVVIGVSLHLLIILIRRDFGVAHDDIIQFAQASVVFLSIFIILTITYSLFVVSSQLPVFISGHDVWNYSKYANLALNQPVSNNILNYDLVTDLAAPQTPTAFLLLAGLSFLLHMPVIDILTLAILIVMTTSAYMINTIGIR